MDPNETRADQDLVAGLEEDVDPAADLSDEDLLEGALDQDEKGDAAQALGELELEEERDASAEGAYGVDPELAEDGKWFNWPKLGSDAQLRIAKTKNRRYTELWDKAIRKYGGRKGIIPIKKRTQLIPVIYSKTLLTGIRGVVLRSKGSEGLDQVTRKEFVGGKWVEKTYAFKLHPDGYLADTLENRHRLLQLYAPDLQDDVFEVGDNNDNFKDDDPEVRRGN